MQMITVMSVGHLHDDSHNFHSRLGSDIGLVVVPSVKLEAVHRVRLPHCRRDSAGWRGADEKKGHHCGEGTSPVQTLCLLRDASNQERS